MPETDGRGGTAPPTVPIRGVTTPDPTTGDAAKGVAGEGVAGQGVATGAATAGADPVKDAERNPDDPDRAAEDGLA